MPDIPAKAIEAAWERVKAHPVLWQYISEYDVGKIVEAAYPLLAAHIRRETAQQIAEAIDTAGEKAKAYHYKAAMDRAAKLARQIGEAP
ncbi:hypothetical protein [Thermoactinospora rubra]|uniref:hypothetical protein n=1 Tax=Thermoactinospora rubra TaxID=1088767 RepID=UPI000A104A8C|nr:hypothetical protein [Thermoactinospora rubra]